MSTTSNELDLKSLQVWPTHWAGGNDSAKYDGHNTIWIDSNVGEIARIRPDNGRVTPEVYARANKLVKAAREYAAHQAVAVAAKDISQLLAGTHENPNASESVFRKSLKDRLAELDAVQSGS